MRCVLVRVNRVALSREPAPDATRVNADFVLQNVATQTHPVRIRPESSFQRVNGSRCEQVRAENDV